MLFIWDLGFPSLVLVLSLLLPLIGFFVRRKWQFSVARQAEIKRLLILASEEAARVELEATIEYGTVSISRNYHQCAVCYCPTTTRCARCKGVRYWEFFLMNHLSSFIVGTRWNYNHVAL